VILGKELAYRIENFPDAGISGFTLQIQTMLIVSDLWLSNVEIILVDHDSGREPRELARKQREEEEAKKAEAGESEKTADETKAEELKIQENTMIKKSDRSVFGSFAAYTQKRSALGKSSCCIFREG